MILFVGQREYFSDCVPPDVLGLPVRFLPFKSGDDPGRLKSVVRKVRPRLIVVFRPETIPANSLPQDIPSIGWFTEPILSSAYVSTSDAIGEDQVRRHEALRGLAHEQFDRFICYNSEHLRGYLEYCDVDAVAPLPVSDQNFCEESRFDQPFVSRPLFVGRLTDHREKFLAFIRHRFNTFEITNGLDKYSSFDTHKKFDISINLHNQNYGNFENRVATAMAHGHIVISEILTSANGLEPNLDYILIKTPTDLYRTLELLEAPNFSHNLMRRRARYKAEYFRASTLCGELFREDLYP